MDRSTSDARITQHFEFVANARANAKELSKTSSTKRLGQAISRTVRTLGPSRGSVRRSGRASVNSDIPFVPDDEVIDGDSDGVVQENSRFRRFLRRVRNRRDNSPLQRRQRTGAIERQRTRRATRSTIVEADGVEQKMDEPDRRLKSLISDQTTDFTKLRARDASFRRQLADIYEAGSTEYDPETARAYREFADELEAQYKRLLDLGIKVEFTDDDPYADVHEMMDDIRNNRLKVFKTASTGSHPYLSDKENDMFRAVHDAFGHGATGRGFDRHGEEAAYQAHRTMFPEALQPILAFELRGSNAYLITNGKFASQRSGLAPKEFVKRLHRTMMMAKAAIRITSDDDNLYHLGGSHHVSCGRYNQDKSRAEATGSSGSPSGVLSKRVDDLIRRRDEVHFVRSKVKRGSTGFTIGALDGLSRNIVVVDEMGFLRCPPGTPNAMWFTDRLGTNCFQGAGSRLPKESFIPRMRLPKIGGDGPKLPRGARTRVDLIELEQQARARGIDVPRIMPADEVESEIEKIRARVGSTRRGVERSRAGFRSRDFTERRTITDIFEGLITPRSDRRVRRLKKLKGRQYDYQGKLDPRFAGLIEADNGFSLRLKGMDPTIAGSGGAGEGYMIARPGTGIKIPLEDAFIVNERGEVEAFSPSALAEIGEFFAVNVEAFAGSATASVNIDGETIQSKDVVMGAWNSTYAHDAQGRLIDASGKPVVDASEAAKYDPDNPDHHAFIYFDATDVFDLDIGDEKAIKIGKERDQQGVGKITFQRDDNGEIVTDVDGLSITDYEELESGGSGQSTIPRRRLTQTPEYALATRNPRGKESLASADMARFYAALRAAAGRHTLDLENFDKNQIKNMLNTIKKTPGFEWIDPDDPDHIYLAVEQMAHSLMMWVDRTGKDDKEIQAFINSRRRWYDWANSQAKIWKKKFGLKSTAQSAAIMAVLSPKTDWGANLSLSEHAMKLLSDKDFVVDNKIALAAKEMLKKGQPGKKRIIQMYKGKPRLVIRRPVWQKDAEGNRVLDEDGKPILIRPGEYFDLEGKSLKEIAKVDSRVAGAMVHAHLQLRSGEYMGHGKGKTPKYTGDFNNPLDLDTALVPGQSLDNYEKVIKIFFSDGKLATLNEDEMLGVSSKVRSFAINILFPDDKELKELTNDTWMVNAVTGVPFGASHLLTTNLAFQHVGGLGTANGYPAMRAAGMLAAAMIKDRYGIDLLPRELQSIVWEQARVDMDGKKQVPGYLGTAADLAEAWGRGQLTNEQYFELQDTLMEIVSMPRTLPAEDAAYRRRLTAFREKRGWGPWPDESAERFPRKTKSDDSGSPTSESEEEEDYEE